MPENKLPSNISNEFKKKSFSELYNNDIWVTILSITIVVVISIYFYILNTIKSQKANWKNQKCNPFFMPFASTINEENSDISYNQKNFEECLNGLNYNMSKDIKSPISSIFDIFLGIFGVLSVAISKFTAFILYLFNFLMEMFAAIVKRLKKLLSATNGIFITIVNFIKSIFAVLQSVYYMLLIVVDSIKYMFTIMTMSFLVGALIPTFTAMAISWVLTALYFAFGPFFWWLAALFLVTSLALTILSIFQLIIYIQCAIFSTNVVNGSTS